MSETNENQPAQVVDLYNIQSPEGLDTHWLVTGYVSPKAAQWIKDLGGHVIPIASNPALILVGLVYDPEGAWTWSHGRREHRQGIEFWTSGEIQESSTGINLLCPRNAEYRSVDTNYLILPDETFDEVTGQVKPEEEESAEQIDEHPLESPTGTGGYLSGEDSLGDLDDHPF